MPRGIKEIEFQLVGHVNSRGHLRLKNAFWEARRQKVSWGGNGSKGGKGGR